MTPYFSIVIPLYNKESHISETLDSVLNQTIKNFEIIIINDGSTDNSGSIVNKINDPRIHLHSTKNKGVSAARNYGISIAKSDLIVFLDADDIWYTDHLKDLKHLYSRFPDCGLYCKAYNKQNQNHSITSVFKNIPKHNDWMGIVPDFFESSLVNCIAWTSAVMVPKSTLEAIGNFDNTITLGAGEDTDLWIRISLKYSVAFFNKVSAIHQLHADNRISNSNTNLRQFINLDQYETIAKTNKFLKKFLDINRYSIYIQYKLCNNHQKAKNYLNSLDYKSLNWKQQLLTFAPSFILRSLVRLKAFMQKSGYYISSFR